MSDHLFRQYDATLDQDELRLVHLAREACAADYGPTFRRAFAENEPFDRDVLSRWAEIGMLGLQVDRKAGGHGAGFMCKVRVAQEMAAHGFAAAFCLNHMQGLVTRVFKHGNVRQIAEFGEGLKAGSLVGAMAMSESTGGSDLGALACRARQVSGGWVLNGTKKWITNGTIVDCVSLLARTSDGSDAGIATFLVRCEGESLSRSEIRMPGARSYRLAELGFSDHFIPEWALLHPPGTAFKAALAGINAARVHVAGMCVGTLAAALRTALEYCGSRVAFHKVLLEHQGLSWRLADVAIQLEAANALVFRAAQAVQRGEEDVSMLAAQTKAFAVRNAVDGIQVCMYAMGAIGASEAHPLAMHAAEVRLASYADGTDEMLSDRIGRSMRAHYLPE